MRWVHESSKWRRIFEDSWESRGVLFRSVFENKSFGQLQIVKCNLIDISKFVKG
jgi:hypothetical protein